MDDEDELRAFREGLEEIEERVDVYNMIGESGSYLRRWRRRARFESLTGCWNHPGGQSEITAYADGTVRARLVGADEPEMDVTVAVDEYERRVKKDEGGEDLSDE